MIFHKHNVLYCQDRDIYLCHMEKNNIVLAPQCGDVKKLYTEWKRIHHGSRDDFYLFMTTPSADREAFINNMQIEVSFIGSMALQTLFAK